MTTSHLLGDLRRAEGAANTILSETTSLVEAGIALDMEQRQALPKGPLHWREVDVKKYVSDLREAMTGPVVYRSRELLKSVGLPDDQIASQILDDTKSVDQLVSLLKDLPEKVANILIGEEIVVDWLANLGIESTIKKINETSVIDPVLTELFELDLPHEVRVEFIELAYDVPGEVRNRAKTLSSNIAILAEIGVRELPKSAELSSLEQTCQAVSNLVQDLELTYSVQPHDFRSLVEGKSLLEAQPELQNEERRRSEQLQSNNRRWDLLAYTLQTLGEDAGARPETLGSLIESVQILEDKCRGLLGDSGRLLLEFLVGNTDFPKKLTFGHTKEALAQLRPFILKGLGGGSWPM